MLTFSFVPPPLDRRTSNRVVFHSVNKRTPRGRGFTPLPPTLLKQIGESLAGPRVTITSRRYHKISRATLPSARALVDLLPGRV